MFLLCACAALATSWARAHGPQIQITDTNDKIVTRTLISNAPYGDSQTDEKSVYVLPILKAVSGSPATDYWTVMPNSVIDPILGSSEFQFGPGLAYGYGHTFADGYHFTVSVLGALQLWNGSAFVNDPGVEAVGAFRGDATSSPDQLVFSGTSSGTQGLAFSNITSTYNSDSHSSMRFRLLGDGASALVAPPDGLYLLTLQVTSNQPGLASSDPFNFLLYKNASMSSINAAVASLNVGSTLVQFVPVPEPSVFMLATFGTVSTLLTRQQRRESKGGL
jgi:hypothetical protein